MASSSITSWKIEGEIVEAVTDFILLVSKITGNCDCSHETERCLLLALTDIANLDSVLRTETSLCNKGMFNQSYGFSMVM